MTPNSAWGSAVILRRLCRGVEGRHEPPHPRARAGLRHAFWVSSASVASRERGRRNNGGINMSNNRFREVFGVLVSGAVLVLAMPAASANAADVHAHEVPAVATPGNVAEAEAILG